MHKASVILVGMIVLLAGCYSDGNSGPTTGSYVPGVKSAPAVGRIELSSPGFEMIVGKTATLVATIYSLDGLVLTDRTVSWRSSAPLIASVSANGTITGTGYGKATIFAESSGKAAEAAITVIY